MSGEQRKSITAGFGDKERSCDQFPWSYYRGAVCPSLDTHKAENRQHVNKYLLPWLRFVQQVDSDINKDLFGFLLDTNMDELMLYPNITNSNN